MDSGDVDHPESNGLARYPIPTLPHPLECQRDGAVAKFLFVYIQLVQNAEQQIGHGRVRRAFDVPPAF